VLLKVDEMCTLPVADIRLFADLRAI